MKWVCIWRPSLTDATLFMAGNGPQVKGGGGMAALEALAAQGLLVFAILIFSVLLLAYGAGVLIGHWHQSRTEKNIEATNFVTNGLLGLLAFTLGLTIAMAQGRFEARRATSLAETNAIGTAWLRASAASTRVRPRSPGCWRATRGCACNSSRPPDEARWKWITSALQETNQMQSLIWGHATAITRERADPLTSALQASLNDVFDQSSAQRWAFAAPIPGELLLFLKGMAVLTIGTIGYQFGLKRLGVQTLAILLVGVWTGAMVLVVDLASAARRSAPRFDPLSLDAPGVSGRRHHTPAASLRLSAAGRPQLPANGDAWAGAGRPHSSSAAFARAPSAVAASAATTRSRAAQARTALGSKARGKVADGASRQGAWLAGARRAGRKGCRSGAWCSRPGSAACSPPAPWPQAQPEVPILGLRHGGVEATPPPAGQTRAMTVEVPTTFSASSAAGAASTRKGELRILRRGGRSAASRRSRRPGPPALR